MPDTMPDDEANHTPEARLGLTDRVAKMMEQAWVEPGYTAPNLEVYPWLWLWDSCFHSIIWAELERPDRAVMELEQVMANQDQSGFVPHMGYQRDPAASVDYWGRSGSSCITQPPMFGHAIAELVRRGIEVGPELIEAAGAGLRFLIDQRARSASGLITVVHPWETGCDDSPRWDDLSPGVDFDLTAWRQHKTELLVGIEQGSHGQPLANPGFAVASVGFNALVSFNARELAAITNDDSLREAASAIDEAVEARWDAELMTWVDDGPTSSGSGRTRTADGLLPLLNCVDPQRRRLVAEALVDPAAYGSSHGPAGVHRDEPSFSPQTYWRGPVWPQLSYLLWVALRDDRDLADAAELVRRGTVAGTDRSDLAEYWEPDIGLGLGAIPQSWTGLGIVMAAVAGQ